MVTNSSGNQSFMQPTSVFFFEGPMGGFLVAWVFSSFHFYLFLVEEFVENHMCFLIVFARERQKEIEEG
jgi:hypothetical protein